MLMKLHIRLVLLAALLAICAPGYPAGEDARNILWDELMPKDWRPFDPYTDLTESQLRNLTEGSLEEQKMVRELIEAQSSAPVVHELDGQRVRIPGYIVPLDFSGTELSEFLLVPYFGACIHVPPPPSNQIVYVKLKDPFADGGMFVPVWVTGTLTTQAHLNQVGDAGYTLEATEVELYEPPRQ